MNRVALPKQTSFDSGGYPCARNPSSIVPLRREGGKEPLFLIHGVDGMVARFQALVRYLEPDQPAYAIQSQALFPELTALTRVEDMARYYVPEVRSVQPQGPYHFLGYSFGGLVAFEMARQLHSFGRADWTARDAGPEEDGSAGDPWRVATAREYLSPMVICQVSREAILESDGTSVRKRKVTGSLVVNCLHTSGFRWLADPTFPIQRI